MGFYKILFYGGIICAIIFLILTIVLFFVLKIPAVFGNLSGSTQRKRIEEIRKSGYESVSKKKAIHDSTSKITVREAEMKSADSGKLEEQKKEEKKETKSKYTPRPDVGFGNISDDTSTEVLGYGKPERPKEVCIVNVAVKPGHDDVPVVREVVWMWPESCKIEIAGCRFRGIAGWLVEWAWRDLKPRNGKPAAAWRRASHINRETQVYDWRYNLDGLTRAYDATVNPEVLLGTRYKYCQYAGGGHCGLMDWLTLYRMEPKVELLAKAGLRRCVCPAGLKALKDRKVFGWVIENKAMLARSKNWNVRDMLYAARHGITIKKAKEHFETVRELSQKLDSMRWNLRIADDGWRPVKLKLDYERLEKLLPKWGVDACE